MGCCTAAQWFDGAWRVSSLVRRKNEPTATISGKSFVWSDGHDDHALIPIRARSRPFPLPQHARPGPFSSKASGATKGADAAD